MSPKSKSSFRSIRPRPLTPDSRKPSTLLQLGSYALDLSREPRIMGILNVTPDSFSDGGSFVDPALAEEHALRLESEGAALLDIGAESSRPGSESIPAEEEWRRLEPVLKRVLARIKIPVSIDTYKAEIMERALGLGVSMINDITALSYDPRSAPVIAKAGAAVVLMHMRGTPQTMQDNVMYADLIREIGDALTEAVRRARDAGILRDRIVVDPGIGFGKSVEGNCEILRRLDELKARLPYPLLIGLSRKSFLRRILNRDVRELSIAHAVAHTVAVQKGAALLRVHDVRETQETLRIFRGLNGYAHR